MTLNKWKQNLEYWLNYEELDSGMAKELRELSKKRDRRTKRELEESFYKQLEFGTSGLRAPLGIGPNRMNIYTVRKITQGICDYITEELRPFLEEAVPKVAIGYDSRINSRLFAECAAGVFAANGIKVYMYDEIMPTAAVSFAVRRLGCVAGAMITASHNPSIYNGYKVYNGSGGQVMPGEQKKMFSHIAPLDVFADVSYIDFDAAEKTEYFETIDEKIKEEYLESILAENLTKDADLNILKVIYTPLNGGGNKPAGEMMKRLGLERMEIVKSQEKPDGSFPTCPYPNPERDEAFDEALSIARTSRADIIIATDPDCDRLGVMIKTEKGTYRRLTGNEVGILLLDYVIRARKAKSKTDSKAMPEKPVAMRSIASSALADEIARANGVEMRVIPNGSCYIGKVLDELEEEGRASDFIFAFEESIEYITGNYAHDEDAVNAAMHILCAAAEAKAQGKTLENRLHEIYEKYGYYESLNAELEFHGIEGRDKIADVMLLLCEDAKIAKKDNGAGNILGRKIVKAVDYLTGDEDNQDFPKLNMVEFRLEGDAGFIVRPSGTEPKLKMYIHAKGASSREAKQSCLEIAEILKKAINEKTETGKKLLTNNLTEKRR